jgi:hypothetical protein
MTLAQPAPPSIEERGARAEAAACSFCKRRLANEYFFTCRKCHRSYCYIHMSRHLPARCERRPRREVPDPVLVAGSRHGGSSANV